jgi:two-component system, cell cycle sensor histidine kinase and response regulator CckA
LESVFNAVQDGIVVTDLEGNFLLINEAEAAINGFPSAEAMKRELAFYQDLYELTYPDGQLVPFEQWPINQILQGKSMRDWELCARRRDTGQEWRLSFSGEPVRDSQGKQILAVVGTRDITKRKRTEAALRASEAQAAGIIESAMDAIVTVDAQQRIVLFNSAAEQMFQCPAARALGQPLDHFIPTRYRQAHQQHVADFGQTHVTRRAMGALGAIYGLRANGEEFPVEASISQIETQGQKLFSVILRDITQRKQDEERLREQAAMLNQAREAILVRDLDGGLRFWNQGAERLYGWQAEEVVDRPVVELLYLGKTAQLEEATKAVVEQGEWKGELRQFTKDRRELVVDGHWTLIRDEQGTPKSILAINSDITEKKKLEAQFLRTQRLESLGTLAGGIAHDLNNILSPVLMGVQMLQMRATDASEQRWLDVIRGNVERGAEMIKQILLFTRGVQGERVPLDTKHLIRETVKILGETFPKSIEVRSMIAQELALVCGDATQLQQVLMNLCVNARDAMPSGGRLLIEAMNNIIDEQYTAFAPDARPGPYVQLTISDTGTGIPEEVKDKIFDPFFTTKELGKGTGLGLSTVLGIVKSHQGFINVYSEAGRGTRFTVYLPAYTNGSTAHPAAQQLEMPAGQGELILVVDDEAAVREITRTTLETFGYRVLTASDGTEALTVYAQQSGEIHAVLTDMMMPYMDGPTTIRALQKLNPHVKVIASSGLAEEEKVKSVAALGVNHFLAKPYSADRLLKTLADLLRGGAAG